MRLRLVLFMLLLAGLLTVSGLVATSASAATAAPMPDPGTAGAERITVAAVDGYWRREFPALTGRTYRSPKLAGPYLGTSGPVCDGQPSKPESAELPG